MLRAWVAVSLVLCALPGCASSTAESCEAEYGFWPQQVLEVLGRDADVQAADVTFSSPCDDSTGGLSASVPTSSERDCQALADLVEPGIRRKFKDPPGPVDVDCAEVDGVWNLYLYVPPEQLEGAEWSRMT